MDIDDIIYPLMAIAFPGHDEDEILDTLENLKFFNGLDDHSDFEQEVWQKYLALRQELTSP